MDKLKYIDWSIDDGMTISISDVSNEENYRDVLKVMIYGINSQNCQIKKGMFGTGEKGKFKLKNICT